MRLIGKIEKYNDYYNFILKKYIDNNGKINYLNDKDIKHFIAKKTGLDDKLFQEDVIRQKITIWIKRGEDVRTLDEYIANETEVEWKIELDQKHIKLNNTGVGFTTVVNYTASDFSNFSQSFKVSIESDEQVYNELNKYLNERKDYLSNKLDEYGIEPGMKLTDIREEGQTFLKELGKSSKKLSSTDDKGNYKVEYSEIYKKSYETSLYMLKYGYAYRYLYKKMYQKAFEMLHPDDNKYKVLSIGCGSKLDLVGMKLAANSLEDREDYDYYYYGVDAADWTDIENANYSLCSDEGAFDFKTIQDFLRFKDSIDANIIILPYSLSELIDTKLEKTRGELGLDGDESIKITPWQYICEVLPGVLAENKFIIMSVYRRAAFENDKTEFYKLTKEFLANYNITTEVVRNDGYELDKKVHLYKNSQAEKDIIRKLNYGKVGGERGLSVEKTKGSIWELLDYKLRKKIDYAGKIEMQTQPILFSPYINYEIVLFERKYG